jgi:hypothetical protein
LIAGDKTGKKTTKRTTEEEFLLLFIAGDRHILVV